MLTTTYSFVCLDVDLYESTLESLKFFYPKMEKGGIIYDEDHGMPSCPGVDKAFSEFFSDKPEKIIKFENFTGCYVIKE